MVMHMVAAIAGQEIAYLESVKNDRALESCRPAEHYGDAMRMLSETFMDSEASSDMDSILATLWLMMQWRQSASLPLRKCSLTCRLWRPF